MSFTRWFRELRGKSNSKEEHSSRNVKVKDERRIKLNRTNSALPTNFKFFDGDFEDGKKRHDKKIKESDKRRYSFNGGSNTKLSRNPRNYLTDDRRSYKCQTDEFQSSHCCKGAESASTDCHTEHQTMIGGELRKSRSAFDHKSVNILHSSPAKGLYHNYKHLNSPVASTQNFEIRKCNSVSSQSLAPPLPPLRGSSSLLASRFISSCGHEKYPSWPSCDASPCVTPITKNWSVEEQLQSSNHSKDRLSAKQQLPQLKTVIEKCEQPNSVEIFETKVINDEARSREKVYMRHLECERIFADDDDSVPCPPDRDISLAKSPHHLNNTFHQYSHSHQDSSYMSQDGDYAECYEDESKTLLTKVELEQYTKDYEENIIKGSHQKQPSYAQSEGYHSYVSSNDSAIVTPLLDRLRRENDVIVSVEENTIADRESSVSSGSSSDTLKWHGSLSDVSVASSSYRGNNSQHIVHSARVQTPQRHHSESVLYLSAAAAASSPQSCWQEKVQKNNQMNSQIRKLFPVNTYSMQPQQPVSVSNPTNLNDNSPTSPKLTVAERINALERQQKIQNNQMVKYIYFDPEKKHKVSGQDLKVMQKKALLLYYERHHSTWRSEPQLSPIPSPPQPPRPRPRLPTPTSRRSSSASDYQDQTNKENINFKNEGDVTNDFISDYSCEPRVHSQYSSSCGSLSAPEVGPMIVGNPISVDDWVPELPPKKAHLRMAALGSRRVPSPDLPPPSPPPVVDDEVFISDEPLPPPPLEVIQPASSLKNKTVAKSAHFNTDTIRKVKSDLISSSATTGDIPPTELQDTNNKINSNTRRNVNRLVADSPSFENKTVNKRPTSKILNGKSNNPEFLRYSQHLYKEEVSTAEYKKQSEPEFDALHQRTKENFFQPTAILKDRMRTQNSEFLAKRSVFAEDHSERASVRYKSTQKLQVNGKLTSLSTSKGQNGFNPNKYEQNNSNGCAFENKLKKIENRNSQFSLAVQRHSEKFPLKLDPHCPPTTYQLSQSSYRRGPRDQEKGLPNFEGSYKRTMSPSPSCTNLTNGFMNGTAHINCSKDIENLDPKSRTLVDVLSVTNGKFETVRHYLNTPHTSQSVYTNFDSRVVNDNSHHESRTPSPKISSEYVSKMLPKSHDTNVELAIPASQTLTSNVEPKQRSSRTPRTQSDPSSVKDTSATLLSSQSSSSSLNLQKAGSTESPLCTVAGIPRSESDLSNMGSTESGYSSLSLNVPSPSVSPTRLSSSSSSSSTTITAPGERNTNKVTTTSWCCTGIQCDIVNMTTTRGEQCKVEANENDSFKYPQKSEIVLRISATTSDAASQTDRVIYNESRIDKRADIEVTERLSLGSQDRSTSPIFKQKSQEEIDCEELCRDLINHLPSKDRLYKILAPKPSLKKSTDYLTNLFNTTILPFSEISSSIQQSEDSRLQERSLLDNELSYQPETGCELQLNEICDNSRNIQPISVYQLQQKKEKLIKHLDHRINILKAEQAAITEECRMNESFGEMISEKVAKLVSTHEAAKYKLHIEEIGHITSLLLGLSGRLAKVENSLQEITDDNPNDKKILESKRDKLICQLEEAKSLKKNIDKRSCTVSALLVKHFSDQEIAEYEYFVHKKSKLLIDSREISEKIQCGEQQLDALKEAISEDKKTF